VTIEGANGQLYGNARFNLQGTITSDPATVGSALTNTTITINPTIWANAGTIEARNTGRIVASGTIENYASGTLTGGTWRVVGNTFMRPIGAGQSSNTAAFSSLMSVSRVVGGNLGVAIIATKGTGVWEFRQAGQLDWTPVGKVSTGKALFLNPADEVRFTADAAALPHTASLSFKAWDKTKFAVGTRGPATGSIVSKETEILTVAIGNTAPTLNTTPDVTLPTVSSSALKPSSGVTVVSLLGTAFSDNGKLRGIALTAADNANGKWQYSLGGNVWIDVGVVSADSAVLLAHNSRIRFVPNAGFAGTATISYKAWDRSAGQAGDRIDTDSGLNSFSIDTETATITVTA
jgi:hypothetical protein